MAKIPVLGTDEMCFILLGLIASRFGISEHEMMDAITLYEQTQQNLAANQEGDFHA